MIRFLKLVGFCLGCVLFVCLPGLIEWACEPLPDWLLAIVAVALCLGALAFAAWACLKNH